MKKFFSFAMLGAVALAFVACSSEEEVNVNPTFDGKAVKTEFAFNVAQGNFAGTRMTDQNVQANSVGPARFLGMNNMLLFSYAGATVPTVSSTKTGAFELGSLATTDVTDDKSAQFYTLSIPVGTGNFVFYGQGPNSNKSQNGYLNVTASTSSELSNIEFGLEKRIPSTFTSDATTNAGVLTAIAAATGWKDATDPILVKMYQNFTGTTGKIRAGYGAAVKRMVDDLKKTATTLKENNPTTSALYTVADAILTAITANEGNIVATFPGTDMPAGAAQLECSVDATTKVATFSYKTTPDVFKTTNADPNKIAYPAQIIYWDSSDLRETPNEKAKTDYPDGVGNWADNANTKWGDWNTGLVKATTRAIAMKRNINYGVAGLHTIVTIPSGNYDDNTATVVTGGTAETFAVTPASFELTGVLVGGQPAAAQWDLLPKSSTFDWVVYDNVVANNSSYTLVLDNYSTSGTQSDVLVALEFTNKLKHTVKKMVSGVLTDVEEDADFYGVDGIIPAGGKFYLVGKLEVAKGTAWTTAYENDRIINEKRIFAQDRMTEVEFKFTANALKNAYETIPDLQSVAMLFGLSVDIEWLPGLTFATPIDL